MATENPLRITAESPLPLQIVSEDPIGPLPPPPATDSDVKSWLKNKPSATMTIAGPRGTSVRVVPRQTFREAVRQVHEEMSAPLIPLSKLTEPAMEAGHMEIPGTIYTPPVTLGPTGTAILHGVARSFESMTSPEGLAMIAAIGPLTSAELEFLGFLNSIGLSGDMLHGSYKAWQQAKELEKSGNANEALTAKTQAITDAAMAIGVLWHQGKSMKAKGDAYNQSVVSIRNGLNSPHLDPESLDYISTFIEKADIEPNDRAHLLAVANRRAIQMAKSGPLIGKMPPAGPEATKPGTMATGPFAGPGAPTPEEWEASFSINDF